MVGTDTVKIKDNVSEVGAEGEAFLWGPLAKSLIPVEGTEWAVGGFHCGHAHAAFFLPGSSWLQRDVLCLLLLPVFREQ